MHDVATDTRRHTTTDLAALCDVELVQQAVGGSTDAFGVLFERHHPMVQTYLRRRVRCAALAEDIASETFARAFRGLHGFARGNFEAWLTQIARNIMRDHFGSAAHLREVVVGDLYDSQEFHAHDVDGLAELWQRFEREHQQKYVALALRDLNADQRRCLRLRFWEGRSLAETAEIMGRTQGAIKLLQHRAVRRLRTRSAATALQALSA